MTIMELSTKNEKVKTMAAATIFNVPESEVMLGFMPPVVKSISSIVNNEFVIVVERKPEMRNIEYNNSCCMNHGDGHYDDYDDENDDFETKSTSYNLPIPWTHWFLRFKKEYGTSPEATSFRLAEVSLYFSQSKITGLDHKFFPAWLPNMMMTRRQYDHITDGIVRRDDSKESDYIGTKMHGRKIRPSHICFGIHLDSNKDFELKLHNGLNPFDFTKVFDNIVSTFWNGIFNCDTINAMWPVIAAFEHDSLDDLDIEGDYCAFDLLEKWEEVKFKDVLTTYFEKALYEFNFMDWINYISTGATASKFDFNTLLDGALDVVNAFEIANPNFAGKPKEVVKASKAVNGAGPYSLDSSGYWHAANGRFASMEEVMRSMNNIVAEEVSPAVVSVTHTSGMAFTSSNNTAIYTSNNVSSANDF